MKNFTCNLLAVLAVTFIASHAFAQSSAACPTTISCLRRVPEIDAAMGTGALALLGGAIMVIRGRVRAKK